MREVQQRVRSPVEGRAGARPATGRGSPSIRPARITATSAAREASATMTVATTRTAAPRSTPGASAQSSAASARTANATMTIRAWSPASTWVRRAGLPFPMAVTRRASSSPLPAATKALTAEPRTSATAGQRSASRHPGRAR